MPATLFEELRTALAERYRVDAEVGHGGMATVFRAEDLRQGRTVAIKVLSPDLAATIGADRFQREIRISSRLSHPGILPLLDSGGSEGLLWYVMPFVEGETLRGRLNREQQLGVEEAIGICAEVCEALAYAHASGVVHRDIKPENILMQHGRAVVADFGIARLMPQGAEENVTRLTATGLSVGTATYMSPEQFNGEAVDGRADIYSLGCVLYELLVGEVPFTGPNALAIMARHTMEAARSIRVVRPNVPPELEEAVQRALAKVPGDRFQSMEAFRDALLGRGVSPILARTMRHTAMSAVPTGMYNPAVQRPPVWRMQWALAGVGLLVLLGGGGAFWRSRTRAASSPEGYAPSSVAVLYFTDGTGGELQHLADGLTESLIDELREVNGLDVISANGVRPWRGSEVDADSVGRLLHVGTVLEGEVDRSGGKAEVTVRLYDAATNARLDSRGFDLPLAEAARLRDSVVRGVASLLRARVGSEVQLREWRAASSDGWTFALRAQQSLRRADSITTAGGASAGALASADSFLLQAVRADPSWNEPWVLRAGVALRRLRATQPRDPDAEGIATAGVALADSAIARDPRSAAAFEARGQLRWLAYLRQVSPDPARQKQLLADAESDLVRAVSLNRRQAGAWASLSALYYRKPNLQEAQRAALAAYEADAYLTNADAILQRLFLTSYDLEMFPEAKQWCDETQRRFPASRSAFQCRLWLVTAPNATPDIAAAWSDARAFEAASTPAERPFAGRFARMLVAGGLARAGLADSARHVLLASRAGKEIDPRGELLGYEAAVRVMLGEKTEAVRLLTEYLTTHPEHRAGFSARIHWWWRDIQNDPGFRRLLVGS